MTNREFYTNVSKGIINDETIAHLQKLYREALADVTGISVQQAPSADYDSNFWLSTILVNPDEYGMDRNALASKLGAANIESRPLWKPMHLQPVFAGRDFVTAGDRVGEDIFVRGLCLPSDIKMTAEQQEQVIEVIRKCFA